MKRQTAVKKTTPPKVLSAEKKNDDIAFYRSSEKPYGVFSNLFRREIVFEGRVYPTSEHAYQAGKAAKETVRDWLMDAPSPALLAMAAHGLYKWDIVPDWSKIKFDRMRQILRAKFTQHPDLQALLLSTGDKRLVEAGKVDNAVNRTWGEVNGRGENMLGKMLMELRGELRVELKAATAKKNSPAKVTKKVVTSKRKEVLVEARG